METNLHEDLFFVSEMEDMDDSPDFNIPHFAIKYITADKLNDFFQFEDHTALNLLHVNCRSLKKNFSSLNILIRPLSQNLAAIAVTETQKGWLTEALQDVYSIPGYKFVSNSRINKSGGGIGIFLKNCLDYKPRPDLSRMSAYIECLFIEICRVGKQRVIIGCVYRPPNTDISLFISELQLILNTIDQITNKIAVSAGDFNLNLLKHSSHPPTGESNWGISKFFFI